jgi:3-oxoacyl-[acyl-carrier protein] reductase
LKKALVTGGTRGIGAATALALVEAGHEVIVTGRGPDGSAPQRGAYLHCDFSHPEMVEKFLETVAGLELTVLVNNAGINQVGPVDGFDPLDFARIQQINVTVPFLLCKAVIPGMRRRGFGRIVNMTSVFGVVSKAGRSAYSTSKFGLLGLSRALALEVATDSILVNCIAPGFVDTELTQSTLGEDGIAEVVSQIPLGRLARPEEIARCVCFLASEENSYMTGQNIIVDGGFTCA